MVPTTALRPSLLLVASLFLTAPLSAQEPPPPWEAGVDYVSARLQEYPVVGIGEIHQYGPYFSFIQDLLRDERVLDQIDDVVVEFANYGYQETLDRFVVELEEVPEDAVRAALRNHAESPTGPWEAPVYYAVVERLRALNSERAPEERIRLVAGDLPINWDEVHSRDDYRAVGSRTRHMGDVVVREVLDRGRSALFVVGGAHLSRNSVSPVSGRPRPNSVSQIEEAHPGSIYVINGVVGFGPRTEEILPRLADVPRNAIVSLDDHFLGDVPAPSVVNVNAGQTTATRPALTRRDLHDAYLWLGPESREEYSLPPQSTYADDDWWNELNRRSLVRYGRCLDPEGRRTGLLRPLPEDAEGALACRR